MMPPRYLPVSTQLIELGASAVASTAFPQGATVALYGQTEYAFAVSQEADDTNSMPVPYGTMVLIPVPAGGYISLIPFNPSGGPAPVSAYVSVTEVLIS